MMATRVLISQQIKSMLETLQQISHSGQEEGLRPSLGTKRRQDTQISTEAQCCLMCSFWTRKEVKANSKFNSISG